jgi:signal peptidase II
VTTAALRRSAWAILSLAVVAGDQASKHLIRHTMALHDSQVVVPGLFSLTHVANRGALFGMLRDLPDPWRSLLFTLVPLAAIILIIYFQLRTPLGDTAAHTGLALILGGALGNLADRIRLGYVTDFLDVFVSDHHWPAFNVADSSICVGVSLLVLSLLLARREATPTGMPPEEVRDASRPV